MFLNKKILTSKLRFSGTFDCIARKRLFPLFRQVLEKRLTLIVAGAGYGKSTLAMQIVTYLGVETAWYRLDKNDRDLNTFLTYLLNSIALSLPDLESDAFSDIYDALNTNQELHETLAILINELERLVQYPLLIVLDDFHLVDDNPDITAALEFLSEHLPFDIHLMLISRNNPEMKLSNIRARREILDINEADLTFTPQEINELYSNIFDLSLKTKSLQHLHTRTGGWAASLILFINSLSKKNEADIDEYIFSLKGTNRIITGYLEENVYNAQTEEIKRFLLKTALFSRINVDVCNRFLNIDNSYEILSDLEKNHLFTFPLDEEGDWYSYHHLFQQFLNHQLRKHHGQHVLNQLHLEIARTWEAWGDDEEALTHYLEGLHIKEACSVLNRISILLWFKGRLSTFQSYIKRIPPEFIESEPWLQFMQAQALDLAGEGTAALSFYKKVNLTFMDDMNSEGAQWCKLILGYYLFLSAEFDQALQSFSELCRQSFENNRILYCSAQYTMVQIHAALGSYEEADQIYSEGMAVAAEIKDREWREFLFASFYLASGLRYMIDGAYQRCQERCRKAFDILVRYGFNASLTLYYYLMSIADCFTGEYARGLQNAQDGLALMQKYNFEHFFPSGWLFNAVAWNTLGMGRTTDAITNGEAGYQKFQELGYRWGVIMNLWVLERIHNATQNHEQKAQVLSEWENIDRDFKAPPMLEGLYRSAKATALLDQNNINAAQKQLDAADRLLKPFKQFNGFLKFLSVRLQFLQGNKQAARESLRTHLQRCESIQDRFWLANEKHWIIPMLVEIYNQGQMVHYLSEVFQKNGEAVKSNLLEFQMTAKPDIKQALSEWIDRLPQSKPPALKVFCLGRFKLSVGANKVSNDRWKNLKAKMLLQYLIFARHRGYIAKEILMEVLWPDEDPAKTSNRLHVTLSYLRKLLEPDLARGAASAYILNQKDSYRIFLDADSTIDVDDFNNEIQLAEKKKEDSEQAIPHYLKAESLYLGDFLHDSPYADWCMEAREQLQRAYLETLTAIIAYYEEKQNFHKCIKYAQKYLQVDRYEEKIYRMLMTFYAKTKNKAMITLIYERCREKLAEELDCPLSQATEDLYHTLKHVE